MGIREFGVREGRQWMAVATANVDIGENEQRCDLSQCNTANRVAQSMQPRPASKSGLAFLNNEIENLYEKMHRLLWFRLNAMKDVCIFCV